MTGRVVSTMALLLVSTHARHWHGGNPAELEQGQRWRGVRRRLPLLLLQTQRTPPAQLLPSLPRLRQQVPVLACTTQPIHRHPLGTMAVGPMGATSAPPYLWDMTGR